MSPSIPHRPTGNSGLTLRAVDSGRGRQGRREGGEHKPQVIDSSWVKANEVFLGASYLEGAI